MSVVKPLLAVKADLEKIQYPVWVTPKLDGIRCLMVDGVAMSRKMKPIPNKYIQSKLAGLHGLDGELMVNGDFNSVQSAVMSEDGEPDFTFVGFDDFSVEGGYLDRVASFKRKYGGKYVSLLSPIQVSNEEDLLRTLESFLDQGYEGLMIRSADGKYKHGRSTVKEGILLKLKKFHDAEATIIDVVERMHNAGELEKDELGYAKRSHKKENMVPTGMAGSLVLITVDGIEFKVGFGPGFTDEHKREFWENREEFKGRVVTYTYQELSKDKVPRFGKLKGFRHENDISG